MNETRNPDDLEETLVNALIDGAALFAGLQQYTQPETGLARETLLYDSDGRFRVSVLFDGPRIRILASTVDANGTSLAVLREVVVELGGVN